MTDLASQASLVSATTYGPSNELLSMTGQLYETRTYNSMLQLTQLYMSGGSVYVNYNYPATQNNGKIASQTDINTGEQVVYTYDALNRLASATATNNSWGQSYSYDGFGNLTDQNVTVGSAPTYHVYPDPTTNHVGSVDANGNTIAVTGAVYDVENRFTGVGYNYQYAYAPGNKRVWRGVYSTNGGVTTLTTDEITFWSVSGQKLATYTMQGSGNGPSNPPSITFNLGAANYSFGGKLIGHYSNGSFTAISADRLGSVGKYYPYGQEKGTGNPATGEKFTGYFRDSETGLDYAVNRYHAPGTGRFLTPDPYRAISTGPANPTVPASWNRYAYVQGDPINFHDPDGLIILAPSDPGGGCWDLEDPFCQDPGPYIQPPTTKDDLPSCDDLLAQWIDSYLTTYKGPTGIGSPLWGGLTTWGTPGMDAGVYLVNLGKQDNVDPAFILGIARAESSMGQNTAQLNGGIYNVYGNTNHFYGGALPLYTNYFDPTNDVFSLIGGKNYVGAGLLTSYNAYGTYEGHESGWQTKEGWLESTQTALFGNVNNITYDCGPKRQLQLASALGMLQ